MPWRLTTGDALYRDIATRNGPLSHYINALLFLIFGTSLRVLVVANLAILAAICGMVFRIFRDACGPSTATVCSLVLLGMFGFSQYTGIANFNYVTPYQHAQTHALALSLLMILALVRGLATRTPRHFALAGVCLGLVLLTKVELILPAVAVAAVGLSLLRVGSGSTSPLLRPVSAFILATSVPVASMTVFLAVQMPIATAWEGVLGNFAYLGTQLASDHFYLHTMGLDDAAPNATKAATALLALAGFALVAAAADTLLPGAWKSTPAVTAAGIACFVVLIAAPIRFTLLARALPLSTLATMLPLTWICVRAMRGPPARRRPESEVALLLFSVFAFALLGKVFLNTRFGHYGFALAMPATLLLTAAIVDFIPRMLASRAGGAECGGAERGGAMARALGLGGVAACVVYFLSAANSHYVPKTLPVGSGQDRILATAPPYSQRADVIARGLARLDELMSEDETLLVWPEGALLNYWLRRENPSRYNLFLPSELDAFGAAPMLEDVMAQPPDWIALLHRDPSDFNAGRFGGKEATGAGFARWFAADYERVETIGAEPFVSRKPGLVILRHRSRGPAS